MNKKRYLLPELEILQLEDADVLTESYEGYNPHSDSSSNSSEYEGWNPHASGAGIDAVNRFWSNNV